MADLGPYVDALIQKAMREREARAKRAEIERERRKFERKPGSTDRRIIQATTVDQILGHPTDSRDEPPKGQPMGK